MRTQQPRLFLLPLFFVASDLFAQPTINSFAPASGPAGTSVTISGTNFSATPASNIVFFGAVRANVTAATVSSLTATVPAGATYQPISVTVNNLTGYSSKPFILTFPGGSNIIQFPDKGIHVSHGFFPLGAAMRNFDYGKPCSFKITKPFYRFLNCFFR